ncbi:uncharacterized protein CCOS01_16931 [Colletotrichum costaricense]|uniref:Uncharacterized protein n=3 Tax=Colletotrichum acutatum species complex TaxID=2707335 RepID=A0AAI9YEF9_9PEZI|nr:uncharacterized protein CCOS01_16931 [Colletotrichum costaricense]XP_060372131.1 uncharacterized protein CTAM01_17306 [Colletotrichum tamarilloi]KAK1451019.1 hypothetical protein CTAM01_17306 [Colletotrichum tamarilloi]KAK1503856.1 hypothetical protein CCOS01_16931 [Colletotrichum costaricense]
MSTPIHSFHGRNPPPFRPRVFLRPGVPSLPSINPTYPGPQRCTMCLDPNCEARTGLLSMWNAQQYLSNAQKELVSIHHERCRVNEEHWDIFRLPIVLPAHDVSGECRSRYYRALGLATRMHHLEQRERVLREGCRKAHQALLTQLARFGGINEISAIATESQMGPQGQPRKRRRTNEA